MVYGRNLRPGTVISRENGWGVVDRVEPFGSGDATADVWMVGADSAIKVRMATTARMSPALRSVAALARRLWPERDQLRQRVAELEAAQAEQVRQATELTRDASALRSRQADLVEQYDRLAARAAELEAAAADTADSTTAGPGLGVLPGGQIVGTNRMIYTGASRPDGVQDRPSRLRQPLSLGMPPAGIPTPGRARLLYDDDRGGVWVHHRPTGRWWLAENDGWHPDRPHDPAELLLLGTTEIPGEAGIPTPDGTTEENR